MAAKKNLDAELNKEQTISENSRTVLQNLLTQGVKTHLAQRVQKRVHFLRSIIAKKISIFTQPSMFI